MRKHLYLITEHEEKERVGQVMFTDMRRERANKNEEGPIHVLDEEKQDFRTVGKIVGLGYVDFADDFDKDVASNAIKVKLSEIDEKWLDKANVKIEDCP